MSAPNDFQPTVTKLAQFCAQFGFTTAEGLPASVEVFLSHLDYSDNVLSKLREPWFGMFCRKIEKEKVSQ